MAGYLHFGTLMKNFFHKMQTWPMPIKVLWTLCVPMGPILVGEIFWIIHALNPNIAMNETPIVATLCFGMAWYVTLAILKNSADAEQLEAYFRSKVEYGTHTESRH